MSSSTFTGGTASWNHCEALSLIDTARLPLVGVTGIRLNMSPYVTGQKVVERLNVLNH